MIAEQWGVAHDGPPDLTVEGSDAELATWVRDHPAALLRFSPSPGAGSDVAGLLGLRERLRGPASGAAAVATTAVPLDAVRLGDGNLAVNMIVLGTAPDRLGRSSRRREVDVIVDGERLFRGRATTVVVATGQYLRGLDVVPRGHPGDGIVEVQVYNLRGGERRAMRSRLGAGAHVPHPRISQRSAREVEVRVWGAAWDLEIDGATRPAVTRLDAAVVPAAYRLLI